MNRLDGGLNPKADHILRTRQAELRATLPEPAYEWVVGEPVPAADVSDVGLDVAALNELHTATIIHRVGKYRRRGQTVRIWQTNDVAWSRLQELADDDAADERLPCGCPADRPSLHNPRDKDGMECRRHGIVMETDAVREVLST